MTVSAEQIKAAQAKGLINVDSLAAACQRYKFPFYLGCTILDKETDGRNIFGHDKGGAFSDPTGANIEVTEERYREFRRLIDSGQTSNGVGPMQITWRGYFPVMESQGLKPWVPADNILFGISILSGSLTRGLEQGLSIEKAFWNTAKAYNGNDSYADDAAVKARTWAATVGSADMEVGGLEINSKMHANARHVTEEVLDHFPAIKQIWTYATFPDHSNCRCTDYMVTIAGLARAEQVKLGDAIAAYLIRNADRVGLNWLIWNRRIYRHQNTDRGHGWADYTGPKPHTDHVHMEVDDRTYQPPLEEDPMAGLTAKEIAVAIVEELNADKYGDAGSTEPDPKNGKWRFFTFLTLGYNRIVEIRDQTKAIRAAIEKLAPPTT